MSRDLRLFPLRTAALVPLLLLGAGCETVDGMGPVEPTFSSVHAHYLSQCAQCHTPDAPGRTPDIEKTLDFTSSDSAYTTLTTGKASGLTGNQAGCNGVPFVTAGNPGQSLLIAVLDEDARKAFDFPGVPGCDFDAITDQTLKVGQAPDAATLQALKDWIAKGAPKD